MVIVKSFAYAIEYAERVCRSLNRKYSTFLGTDFDDEFSEQKTRTTLEEIVKCMERGDLVIMYGLEILY